jgi:hypothetical protein
MLQVIACNTWLQGDEMDLKRSDGVPASVLERTWCDQAQLRSNARSMFERRPSQPASHAVALASPMILLLPTLRRGIYVRSNTWSTIDYDQTHSLRSSAVL